MNGRCLGVWAVSVMLAPPVAHSGIFTSVDPASGMTIVSNIPPARALIMNSVDGTKNRSVPASAPSAFPRVSVSRQRELDGGRRAVLQAELTRELRALKAAEVTRAQPEVLDRHQANVAALQREMLATRE